MPLPTLRLPLTGANARLAEKRGSVTPSFRGTCTPTFCQFAWRTRPDRAGLPHSVPHMSGSIRRHRSSPGSWLAVEGNRSEALSCEPKSRAPRGSGARAPSASGVCPIVELAKTFAVPRQTVVAAVAPDHPCRMSSLVFERFGACWPCNSRAPP